MGLTGIQMPQMLGNGQAKQSIRAPYTGASTGAVNGGTVTADVQNGGSVTAEYGMANLNQPNLQNPSARNRNPGTAPLPDGRTWEQIQAQNAASRFAPYLGAAANDAALDFASLGVNRGYLGQRAGFDQQQSALNRQQLLDNNSFDVRALGNDQATLALRRQQNMLGLDANNIARGQIAANRGFAQRDLDSTLADAMRRGIIAQRDNNSQAIARGGWYAPFRGARNTDIYNNTRAAGDQARLGFDRTMSGLGAQEQKLGLDDQQTRLADQILGQQAASLGIKADQLKSSLQSGLAKLGLDSQISAADLAYKMQNSSIDEMKMWQQVFNAAMEAQGMDQVAGDIMAKGFYGIA